jgi:hypothetical protein
VKNIVILAAGPAKPNRNRHLEVFDGKILIDRNIGLCRIKNTKLYIVINSKNNSLIDHVRNFHNDVKILYPKDEKIYSTFEVALSMDGDCILVCGDVVKINEGDVEKFVESEFESASCMYPPWGNNPKSQVDSMVRRADVGDCINMISHNHKKEFLGEKNYKEALTLFYKFYPNGNGHIGINEYWYNDVGTFMCFAFYKNIWSDSMVNSDGTKGLIQFTHKIYGDND